MSPAVSAETVHGTAGLESMLDDDAAAVCNSANGILEITYDFNSEIMELIQLVF